MDVGVEEHGSVACRNAGSDNVFQQSKLLTLLMCVR